MGTASTDPTEIMDLGRFFPQIHDPIKGTLPHPPVPPNFSPHDVGSGRDQFHGHSSSNQSHRAPMGKLPKLNFPMFDGDNPKLWRSKCES
jgi:hypothetical protein